MALQYSPFRLLSEAQLTELHGLMGEAPAYGSPGSTAYDATVVALNRAKDVLRQAYGFSDANMAGW